MSLEDEDSRILGACTYELDATFRIVSVDAGWSQFALANAAPELAQPQLIGQPLLANITDRATAHLYEQLFQKVLRTGRSMSLPFRCDSPELRRFFELHIEPRAPSGLRFRSRLLRVEPRPAVALLDPATKREGKPIRMCSFCKSVEANGRWLEVEEALVELRFFDTDVLPPITHGVCPSCFAQAMKALDS